MWPDISTLSGWDQSYATERADETIGGDLLVLWVKLSRGGGNPVSVWSELEQNEQLAGCAGRSRTNQKGETLAADQSSGGGWSLVEWAGRDGSRGYGEWTAAGHWDDR